MKRQMQKVIKNLGKNLDIMKVCSRFIFSIGVAISANALIGGKITK